MDSFSQKKKIYIYIYGQSVYIPIYYKVYSLKWQNFKKSQSSMANFGVF